MDSSILALVIVAIIIVAALSDDKTGLLVLAGGLLFLAVEIWKQGGSKGGGFSNGVADPGSHTLVRSHATLAPQKRISESRERFVSPAPHNLFETYLGAIDLDPDVDQAQFGSYRDRRARDGNCTPTGNPFAANRTFAPSGGPACFDDEANGEEYDGDERNVYSSLSRNDPLRATIGSMNRLKDFDPFVREELEEEEDRPWWGRHEI